MPIRMSGFSSGLDTDAIVSAMVMNYRAKVTKQQKAQASLSYKKDALKSINTDVYNLYSSLDKLRFSSAYSLKTTSVSDPTKAKITAANNATNGTQSLEVKELAQAGYLTGGSIKTSSGGKVTSSTKMSEILDGEKGTVDLAVNGKKTSIKLTDDMTVNQFLNKLKDAGVNASFDENYGRFYISSKKSGVENDFSLTASDSNGLANLKSLGLFTIDDTSKAEYQKWANYTDDDKQRLIDESYAKSKVSYEKKADEYANRYNEAWNWIQDREKEYESLGGLTGMTEKRADLKSEMDSKYGSYFEQELDDEGNPKVDDKGNPVGTYNTDKIKADAEARGEDPEEALKAFNSLQSEISGLDKKIKRYDAPQKVLDDTKDFVTIKDDGSAQAAVSGDDAYNRIVTEVDDTNAKKLAEITDYITNKINDSRQVIADIAAGTLDESAGAKRIEGKDSTIELNGVEYTSNSNTFNINGLNIEATAKTNGPLSITTSTDTQGIYDKIKDFIEQYNDIINKITKLYNAPSAKGYEPLSDEEKEAMSEKEIEQWETKVKDAILRRDGTLGGIQNTLTQAMAKTFTIDGKNYGLGSFGISTLGILSSAANEQNAYHIDGDQDDSVVSGKTDKLMAAINSDPDKVISFFQQLTSGVYKALDSKMKSTSLSSAYTIYNDKEMNTQYSNYSKTIKQWQDKVADMETAYYKKFTAMEKTLSKLQSSTNALSGYFGG